MQNKRLILLFVLIIGFLSMASNCRNRGSNTFTIAMDGKFSTLDPIGSVTVDANAERLRTLMYNSLVKKDDKFDYVGDLAKEYKVSEDGLTYTFTLHDNVKFHNGNVLTSADVKYTMDKLFASEGGKAAAFFETIDDKKTPIITAIETPDEKTVTIKISRPELKNQLIPNLVPIAIIPNNSPVGEGTNASTNPPPGTGAYKFDKFDTAQNVVALTSFEEAWEGAPNIKQLQVKILADANALQAELLAGNVDLAPAATNLEPDTLKSLNENPDLKVEEFDGSNIQYLWFNTEAKPVNDEKVRQAIAHAVNREKIINDQLDGKATIASSILPQGSWAFTDGVKYDFDIEKSKKLLDEAGYTDKDGDGVREMEKIIFKISSGSKPVIQYSQIIQSQLKEIGIPVEIESLEFQTMLSQVKQGQFQMTTGRWVGGNQDPIFFKDLFASSEIPDENRAARNRGRYKNKEVDDLLEKALKELDKEKAKEDYVRAWNIISKELPLFPLWYPKNMVVSKSNVKNIQINASGDWDFVRKMTVDK
jgi:peptide/nickel transport system substrate-binding protein